MLLPVWLARAVHMDGAVCAACCSKPDGTSEGACVLLVAAPKPLHVMSALLLLPHKHTNVATHDDTNAEHCAGNLVARRCPSQLLWGGVMRCGA
jgi:hypothetical protein